MPNTTDYQILSAETAPELVELVKAQIANGWQVYGGLISINHTVPMNRRDNFYQAMVKTPNLMEQMNNRLNSIVTNTNNIVTNTGTTAINTDAIVTNTASEVANTNAIKASTASIDAKTPAQG